jgi:hypothetical protein
MKKYNIGISILLVVLSALIYYGTRNYEKIVSKAPGAGFWPRALAVVLIVLAVILLIETLVSDKYKSDSKPPFDFKSPAMKRVYVMLGVFAVYAIILYLLGFVIASLLFIPAVMYALRERNKKVMLLTSVALTGSVYFFFSILLRVTLPLPFFM